MRTQLRRVREAVAEGDGEKAQAEFRVASKRLDQAASKNLIHKNAAARSKSRLNKLVKSVA
jgi:small subunit ribosomal protein S20